MQSTGVWNRRGFLGGLGALIGATFRGTKAWGLPPAGRNPGVGGNVTGLGATGSVYDELGVTTLINGQGTETVLGGSLIPPEVEAVMAQAARHFVGLDELEKAVGKRISQMLKLPDGYGAMVTCGAAAAMQSGYAGILTGSNPDFIKQIPDLTGMKSEVIIQKAHRYAFDHAIRTTGVKLVEVETRDDLHNAINPRTAALHFTNYLNDSGQIKVDEFVKLAKQANLPCLNDAAADTPPVSRLWDYANMGYDLVAFSGGKAIRGPQCAGLLLGRQELVDNALLNTNPYEDALSRTCKVGKEEIVGMLKALELYLAEDHTALTKEWWRRLQSVSQSVSSIPGVKVTRFVPDVANHVPYIQIALDPARFSLTAVEFTEVLRKGTPSIVLDTGLPGGVISIPTPSNSIVMNSFMLQPGEAEIVAQSLSKLLRSHSA